MGWAPVASKNYEWNSGCRQKWSVKLWSSLERKFTIIWPLNGNGNAANDRTEVSVGIDFRVCAFETWSRPSILMIDFILAINLQIIFQFCFSISIQPKLNLILSHSEHPFSQNEQPLSYHGLSLVSTQWLTGKTCIKEGFGLRSFIKIENSSESIVLSSPIYRHPKPRNFLNI